MRSLLSIAAPSTVTLGLLALILGALAGTQPLIAALALVAAPAAVMLWARPLLGLYVFMAAHIAVPVYIRMPRIGPIEMPVALALLMALFLITTTLKAPPPGAQVARDGDGHCARWLMRAFMAFGILALLSLLDPLADIDAVNFWIKAFVFPLVLMIVITRLVHESGHIDRAFAAMLAGATLASVYALYEYVVGANFLLDTFLIQTGKEWDEMDLHSDGNNYRSFSVFSQPIEFATCVGMIIPYAVTRLGSARTWLARVIIGAVLLICFAGILVAFSRTAFVSAAIVALAVALLSPRLRPLVLPMIGTFALAFAALWPILGDMISRRLADVDNVTLRVKLWQTAAAIFSDHPILGVGFGNFPKYQMTAIREHQIGPFFEFGTSGVDKVPVAESLYFQMAAEMGFLGVLAFAAVLMAGTRLLWRQYRQSSVADVPAQVGAIAGAVVVYLLNAVTVTAYTHYVSTMLCFGAMFGLAMALARMPVQPSTPGAAAATSRPG